VVSLFCAVLSVKYFSIIIFNDSGTQNPPHSTAFHRVRNPPRSYTLHSAGAQTTDPVSPFSECVYTQLQPKVRRRILSETLKVLESSYGRIHGILPWPMRGRPRNGHRRTPVRKKLQRFHFINKSLRNAIFAESNNRYTFSSCALPVFKSP
jgi:hypothetical protein